ncbi:MAG: hypothetical protein WC477_07535 [Patescibacteria group bacterium]
MPELDLSAVPAGLVLTADIVNRQPGRAMDVILAERHLRELTLLMIRQNKRKLSWNPGRTGWMAFLIGSTALTLALAFDAIMSTFRTSGTSLGGTVNELAQLGIQIPSNMNGMVQPLISVADKSQTLGWGGSIGITLACLLIYGIFKFVVVAQHWGEISTLKESEQVIQEELATLQIWMNEYTMNVSASAPIDTVGKKG